ncbi:hypothetical protein [Paraburkholderia aspalathi]|uniref:hypothetical protein n=1 Tax=Paraburkholderia aspalathi TaxID=1324617 RepID=UPI001AFE4E84|nr:hypothetical protein [Paraburkholderia aspalathi]CAE6846035.1 hypothetical protein R20943_07344 [Paraburkholderia aspalathi]
MTQTNSEYVQESQRGERDGLPVLYTVVELAKANHVSKGLIYKILKQPDGPAFIRLGDKVLIESREWVAYLARKTTTNHSLLPEPATVKQPEADASKDVLHSQTARKEARAVADAPRPRRGQRVNRTASADETEPA